MSTSARARKGQEEGGLSRVGMKRLFAGCRSPDALVDDPDASLSQEFRDVAEAKRKAQVHPRDTLDVVRRKAVPRVRECAHLAQL